MLEKLRDWFGWGSQGAAHAGHGHDHGSPGSHGHTHGVIDPSIASTERGIWAVKWSFVILAITSALQLSVVITSGSVALLADTIHNIGDATTAIPLWIAFRLAQRKPSKMFTYGLGRVEDLAGIVIVLIILFSAIVAGYEAINRLMHPQPITQLLWVAIAGIVGFVGNEAVAVFRIRVGREIESTALIADGYHARTDGLTSLAVVLGAFGVWLGFPLADPIIGLLITVAIFGIVWQSAVAVLTRMLDGVEPNVTDEIRHAAEHVPGIDQVVHAKARWLGHRLHADVAIAVDDKLDVARARAIAEELRRALLGHIPALRTATITFGAPGDAEVFDLAGLAPIDHHHAPDPFKFTSPLADGLLELASTAEGERMRLTVMSHEPSFRAVVTIDRSGGAVESLVLQPKGSNVFESSSPPAEPHTFNAQLRLTAGGQNEVLPFRMEEPAEHANA